MFEEKTPYLGFFLLKTFAKIKKRPIFAPALITKTNGSFAVLKCNRLAHSSIG